MVVNKSNVKAMAENSSPMWMFPFVQLCFAVRFSHLKFLRNLGQIVFFSYGKGIKFEFLIAAHAFAFHNDDGRKIV